jgi:hypothetical protein
MKWHRWLATLLGNGEHLNAPLSREPSSQKTLRWRERDSNFRYLSQGAALSELIWRLRPRGLPALPVRQPTRP